MFIMGAARGGRVVITVALLACAGAFNFAPEFARVFHDPRNDTRSYFGFSVALRKHDAGAEVVVGAPRANDYNATDTDESRPGAVYVCNALGKNFCESLLPDGIGSSSAGILKTAVGDNKNSGLGTVVVTQDSGNAIMTCAPRWKSIEVCANVSILSRVNGICYLTTKTSYPANRVTPFLPFSNCGGQIFKKQYYFVFAEAGMSVQIVKNLSEIILGAPGISNWKGMILRHRFDDKTSTGSDIPCPSCYKMHDVSYFGYAVGYGKFTRSGDISYVSSAPRAGENKGLILVFNFEKHWTFNKVTQWRYNVIKQREGTQLGEYFGASLCVADFNKDGLDDLIVGAPQHSLKTNTGDEGCIYVLLSTENDWKYLGKVAGSDQRGARFGTAIALLGDINIDGYPDVAVGAPYENNRQGAIYIYHGNKNGLNLHYSQKIKPSDTSFLRGFGASISKGLDTDENNVNDIAVGAYISGHVVLIKTYPVVTIIADLMPSDRKITFTTETFDEELCFSISEKYKSLTVDVAITLKLDQHYKRVSFKRDNAYYITYYNITLQNEKQHCQNLTLFIQNKTEFSKPIEFLVEYKLITRVPFTSSRESIVFDNKSDKFCKHCAIINPREEQWKKWQIQYIPDSAPADLQVQANFLNVKSPFIIGTTNTIKFEVLLHNNKEQAMDTYILITIPLVPMSFLKQFPNSCQVNIKVLVDDILELVCEVESPFHHGTEHYINITLVVTEVPSDLTNLNISVIARSISLEESEKDNQANLFLPLERLFDLEIHGKSVEYSLVDNEHSLNDEEFGEEQTVKQILFKHSYQIINNGPSPATNVDLYFEIPTSIQHHTGDPVEVLSIIEQVAYLEQQPLSCTNADELSFKKPRNFSIHDEIQFPSNRTFILSCSETSVLCTRMRCKINFLYPGSRGAKISFALNFMPEKLGTAMGLKDIILIKTFGLILSSSGRFSEVSSVVWTKPPRSGIGMGMIAVCIGCGILILLTLVLLLIKCGFFTRQDPMEKYFRKKTALALKTKNIPASTFYSPRGSIMVF